jgi:hypothetical protein
MNTVPQTPAAAEAEAKAREHMAVLTMPQIVDAFELTEGRHDPEIHIVRGWLMDEMERRNPAAFEAWLMGTASSPRQYLLPTVP